MTTPSTISEAIDENARGPKRVQVGGQSVEAHPIQDQIEADRYAKAQAAAANKQSGLGIRVQRITPRYP